MTANRPISDRQRRAAIPRLMLPLALLFALAGPSGKAEPTRSAPAETEIKAALLYKFAKFVVWPNEVAGPTSQPLVLCVFGTDPLGLMPILETIAGQRVRNRPVFAQQILTVQQATDHCQTLFIDQTERRRLPALLAQLGEQPILTVSDISGFAQAGGMIELTTRQRLSFTINLTAARQAGLHLSAQLLQIAERVLQPSDQADSP